MKYTMCLVFVFLFCNLFSALLENSSFEYLQPDGSKVSLLVSGDEFDHRIHDAAGYTIIYDPVTGYAVYAYPDGAGIVASSYRVGSVDPTSLGIAKNLRPDPSYREQRITEKRMASENSQRASSTGTINNIVVFIRFLDQTEYTAPISSFDTMCNSTSIESVHGYFLQDSNSQLTVNSSFYPTPVGGIVRSFQDGHNRNYFSPYNAETNPAGYTSQAQGHSRMHAMFRMAINVVGPSVPAGLVVDGNGDGYVDNVVFVMQGDQDPEWSSMLWPQQYSLEVNLMLYETVFINSKIVSCYNVQMSNMLVSPADFSITGTGIICHEFSHSIGFPDLYHYTDDDLTPVGGWELMGSQGVIPQPHFSFAKQKYGHWTGSITTITPTATATTYTLESINDSPFASYKVASSQANQFYVLEYRRNTGAYGSSLPGSGLIVYRVTQYYFPGALPVSLEGNSEGPPDEIYVYRPSDHYGNLQYDGQISDAHMSQAVGRASFHNYTEATPWLYTQDGQFEMEGNLMLTDITENGDGTISFTLHGSDLNVWHGDTDDNWNVPTNWSKGTVPTGNDWVEIPVTYHNYNPRVTADAEAYHITVCPGAGLTVGVAELHVMTDLNDYGMLSSASPLAVYMVDGNVDFQPSSYSYIYTWDAHIYVQGNATFYPGSTNVMESVTLEFYGHGNSSLLIHSAVTIENLISTKDSPYTLNLSSQSTAELTILGNLSVNDNSAFTHTYSGNTRLYGNLQVYGQGYCALNSGTLVMQGNRNATISIANSSCYLHNLRVSKTEAFKTVTIQANLKIDGNLRLDQGTLNLSPYTLQLGGDYYCHILNGVFDPGVSTVVLIGSNVQTISSEHFYRLELNKSGGYWSIPDLSIIEADYYNWTAGSYIVSGGSFSASFLDDPGIFGIISLSSGSISYHQASNAFIDLRGQLTISGGTFSISGGSGIAYLAYIDSATLNMSGGILDFQSQGILVPDMFDFTENITGGTIRTVGSLIVERMDFIPTGNTIELYGSADCELNIMNGSSLHNLICNKASLRSDKTELFATDRQGKSRENTRSNAVTCNSGLEIDGSLSINNGSFDVNGQTIQIAGNLGVNSVLKMRSGGSIEVENSVLWNGMANVNSGSLSCGGDWSFGSSSTANLNGCTVTLYAPSGSSLCNESSTASFGNLVINGLGESPVYHYSSSTGEGLKVAGSLEIYSDNSLVLGPHTGNVGSCNIHPQASLLMENASYLDISGSLTVSGTLNVGLGYVASHGSFNFPDTGSLNISGGYFFNDAPWIERENFQMRGAISIVDGTFEITDNSVALYSHATRVFNNAYLKMGRSFSAVEAGSFQPISGTLYLEGEYGCELNIGNGNYLKDLVINKDYRYANINLGYPTTINGDLQLLSGYLYAGSQNLVIMGFAAIGGTMYMGAGSFLSMSPNHTLNVTSGGYLYLGGNPEIPVVVTRGGSTGYYGLNVLSGGTIAADYTNFEFVDGNGLYLQPGSFVDPYHCFKYCSFTDGEAGGTMLRVDNSQVITIDGASFPTNTWSGASNVSKTVNMGELTLINYSGQFSGSTFEQDSFNRITWNLNGILPVQSLRLFRAFDTGEMVLVWEYGSEYDSFKVLVSSTPDGTYSLLETTTQGIYIVPSNLAKAFFRVVAVKD